MALHFAEEGKTGIKKSSNPSFDSDKGVVWETRVSAG
jgi:hypothetical protein